MDQEDLYSPVARNYAQSLLELAASSGEIPGGAEIIGRQLAVIRQLIRDEPMTVPLLVDPAIGAAERNLLLDRLFKGRVEELLLNFLHVLCDKGRLELLNGIAGAYQVLLDQRQGKVEVDVTVAHRLTGEDAESVRQRIAAALKREVVMHHYVDERIMGGLVLRVGDKLIDGSVRAQLASMREKFQSARPG